MLIRVAGMIVLLVSFFMASALGTGSWSIRWVIDSSVETDADTAVDLNATNFDSVLKETPASFAIVEFFAHWCPGCRNYKPHYEKLASVFNGHAAAHPGMVLMARVDCALKLEKQAVIGVTMPWTNLDSNTKQDKSDLILIDNGRTADRFLGWINKQLGSSYGLDDEKFENDHLMPNTSDPEQITKAVCDIEEATFTAFDIIT